MSKQRVIRLETKEIETIVGVTCDNCDRSMEVSECNPNYGDDSLGMWLIGGYGMFFDGRNMEIDLCKDCADKFFLMFPRLSDKVLGEPF